MNEHEGRLAIVAATTMVHQRLTCLVCKRPVDNRVVLLTNDTRVLHAGCVPDHVRVPPAVLIQAIRRLERMLERATAGDGQPRHQERVPPWVTTRRRSPRWGAPGYS